MATCNIPVLQQTKSMLYHVLIERFVFVLLS